MAAVCLGIIAVLFMRLPVDARRLEAIDARSTIAVLVALWLGNVVFVGALAPTISALCWISQRDCGALPSWDWR